MGSEKLIYGYQYGPGLGDLWIHAMNIAMLSSESENPVYYNPVPRLFNNVHNKEYYEELINEILSLLDFHQKGEIISVNDQPTNWLFRYKDIYIKTKIKPTNVGSKVVVYQEDARSEPPDHGKLSEFHCILNEQYKDIRFIRLGLPLTLTESIDVAAVARSFIGFPSGMTHVCLSLGIPVFLPYIPHWFFPELSGKNIQICDTVSNMFKKACL